MSEDRHPAPNAGRIYLDNAASQRLRPEARQAMDEVAGALNAAGQYATGRSARCALEDAREQIAQLLGADPVEVVFTGSGSEANNIAVQGLAFAARTERGAEGVACADTEHPAVLEPVRWLTEGPLGLGFYRIVLPVDEAGRVSAPVDGFGPGPARVGQAGEQPAPVGGTGQHHIPVDGGWWDGVAPEVSVDPSRLAVLTCMWANNETGNIQPVAQLAAWAAVHGVPFHTDAVQAVGHLPVDFHALGATTLAASAHKFGGPKSVGILLARRDARLLSPVRGGGQERGLRPGTVNVQGAVGAAAALAASIRDMERDAQRQRRLRERVWDAARTIPGVLRWTAEPALPGHLHLGFPGAEGDSLIMLLDGLGVDASTGSACSAGVNRASHVLEAMGVDLHVARGALRLTLGPDVTEQDAERVAGVLPEVVERARAAGMAFGG